tara:strand:+ start:16428 stop:16652 length:225 start_codon:yes stop_codon:yes gene_type:complete
MLKEKHIENNYSFQLEPGMFSPTQTQKHSISNLKKMYKSMGFKKIVNSERFAMKVGDFLKWCKSKYSDEFFNLI